MPSPRLAPVLLTALLAAAPALAADEGGDLDAVRRRGVLRHLGVPYANFVTGAGDGLDVDLMKRFAERLGVRYEYVETDWARVIPDLVGRKVSSAASDPATAADAPIRGDVVANGMTILPWRARSVAFSSPTFPTQVWVVARSDMPLKPIAPSGDVTEDIAAVKRVLAGRSLVGVPATCLDPALYQLDKTGAKVVLRTVRLDEVAPLLVNGAGDLALLDVADAMIALRRWPGRFKVIGPISQQQEMAVGFRQDAPELRRAFEALLAELRRDGTFDRLVAAYFPEAPVYFPRFFAAR